jgi:hypothetical protein
MTCLNNKMNNNYHVMAVAATIFTLALVMVVSSMATQIAATTPTTSNTTATSNITATTPFFPSFWNYHCLQCAQKIM